MFFPSILKKLSIFVQISTQSNTNSLNLFCENSTLNSANFTKRILFLRWFLTNFPESKNILHKCYLWQIPRLYLCKQEAEMVGWIRKVVFFDNSGDKALLAKIIIPQGKYLFRANPEYIYNFLQLCRRNFEKLCFIHIIDFHRLFFTKPLHTKGF